MSREETCRRIELGGLVPVVRAPSSKAAARAARALRAGGVEVVEITMTVPDSLGVLHELSAELGAEVLIGAGTVLDVQSAEACIDAGAEFIVCPGLDLHIIQAAHSRGKSIIPGALTPTEVVTAWRSGADLVKIFPCSAVGGAKYIRALRAPLPDVKLVPTGGVNLTTLPDYLAAGAAALGVGAALVDIALLEREGEAALAAHARKYAEAVRQARSRQQEST